MLRHNIPTRHGGTPWSRPTHFVRRLLSPDLHRADWFSPRESFPLSHKATKTKPCKRRISIHHVGLETEICISSMYHIQQDTGISLQSWLHPGALNKPRFAEYCVDTSRACKTVYLNVPSVKEVVQAAKVCLVLPRASGNPSFILWLPSIKKKKKKVIVSGLFLFVFLVRIFVCFLSSANRNASHERLFTLMWLVTVLRSKTPNYRHTITFSSLMRSKRKPGIRVKLQYFFLN